MRIRLGVMVAISKLKKKTTNTRMFFYFIRVFVAEILNANYSNSSSIFLNLGSDGRGASAEMMLPCGSININLGIPNMA
ncbi:hypothetical protein AELI107455_09280 [Aequorivita lipolytica]